MTLKSKWIALFANDNIDIDKITTLYDVIEYHYSEKHRAYHTLAHIEYMLQKVDTLLNVYLLSNTRDAKAVYLAVWFHDIIYSTNQSAVSNELSSAEFACQSLTKLGIDDEDLLHTIYHLILCTKSHTLSTDMMMPSILEEIMIDADLAILGDTSIQYATYAENVYFEWNNYSIETFLNGRLDFLTHMVSKSDIFKTEYMKELYSEQAIINLTNEIESVKKLIEAL